MPGIIKLKQSLTRRIFLAVPVPPQVAEYRVLLQQVNESINGIKWMRLHNLHLTGYFIGNVPTEEVQDIIDTISPVISLHQSFELQFEDIVFAPSRDPRMIWGKYRKHPAFTELSAAIHSALGKRVEENKFYYKEPVPHITLARFHNKVYRHSGIQLPPVQLPSLEVNVLELWESKPSPEGVKYESVMKLNFGA